MNKLAYKINYRRNLPHIQPPGATLFFTFRLAGSIPRDVQIQLVKEAERIKTQITQTAAPGFRDQTIYDEQKRMFAKWDAYLDNTDSGPHWLRNPNIARFVSEALHYRDGRVYNLDTYCIMSNHVHFLFTPLEKEDGKFHSISSILHSLKIYTALKGNEILEREGQFWQHENYDHYVRDEAELGRIRKYILNNPVKAGLVESWDEWPWTYCKYL